MGRDSLAGGIPRGARPEYSTLLEVFLGASTWDRHKPAVKSEPFFFSND